MKHVRTQEGGGLSSQAFPQIRVSEKRLPFWQTSNLGEGVVLDNKNHSQY